MIQNGTFRQARTDDPNIIAIEVDRPRTQRNFANDESLKRFIARQPGTSTGRAAGAGVRTAAG